jgi:hypothetical protein
MLSFVATFPATRSLTLCVLSLFVLVQLPTSAQSTDNRSGQPWLEKTSQSNVDPERLEVKGDERRDLQVEYEIDPRYTSTGTTSTSAPMITQGKKSGTESTGKKSGSTVSTGKKSGTEGVGKKTGTAGYGDDDDGKGKKGYGYDVVTGDDDDSTAGDDDDSTAGDDDDSTGIVCEPNYELGDNPCVDGCGHAPVPNPFNPNPVEAEKEQFPSPCLDYECICADSGCARSWDIGCIKWYMQCQTQTQVCGPLAEAPAAVIDYEVGESCVVAPVSANVEWCYPQVTAPVPPPFLPPTGVTGDDDDGSGKKTGYPGTSGDDDDGSGKKTGYGPGTAGDDDDGSGKKTGTGPGTAGDDDDGSGKKTGTGPGTAGDDDDGSGKKTGTGPGAAGGDDDDDGHVTVSPPSSVTAPSPVPPPRPTYSPAGSVYGKSKVAGTDSIFGMP